ncbi:Exocyst complex component EXO70B1 [Abeliophyllum distichum]|uniref:Exocyst complex component EXO70B1 n=1 Tax=Abeliophyllum distichum TaxID=126358 RepID=A0ABD1UM02_9LAMI
MVENGEHKLIAVARHIANTLGHTDTMTDDILKIFSNFDGILREKLTEKLFDEDPRDYATLERTLKSLDRQISHYVSSDQPIWSDSAESSSFLDSVDQLISAIRDWTQLADDKNIAACLDWAEDLLQQSMFRLEDKFRSLVERGAESFDLTRGESTHLDFSDEDDSGEEDGDDNEISVEKKTNLNKIKLFRIYLYFCKD